MDWERAGTLWTNRDFKQFEYNENQEKLGDATVITRLGRNGDLGLHEETLLDTGQGWKCWLDKASFLDPINRQSGVCVITFRKAKPVFENSCFTSLSQLAVTQEIFSEIVGKFQIQPCITRTIGREVVYFSTQSYLDEESRHTLITSTARTASLKDQDCAVASVYDVEANTMLAIVFGYDDHQSAEISKRIRRLSPEHFHPFLIPGIFFELERKRLEECIDSLLDEFALKSTGNNTLNLKMSTIEMTDYLQSCYRSQDMQNQIGAFKKQLQKLHRETSKFERSISTKKADKRQYPSQDTQCCLSLIRAGRRIKSRIEEMCDILDDKANECKGAINNTSITMQTLWNHFALEDNQRNLHFSRVSTDLANMNKEVTESMQKDSSQMRSIALLTMVFLPISTVSSIFSTSLFSWNAGPGEQIVSRYVWVFIVISLSLTSVVVGSWVVTMRYATNKLQKTPQELLDVENASISSPRGISRRPCSMMNPDTRFSAEKG